jgi:F-type H+-transporting ATPase subunit epsilon
MQLELVSLDGIKYKEDAYAIILPTEAGEITVMPGHEPLLSLLAPGAIVIRKHKKDADTALEHYATFGGVLEITSSKVRVLVDEATHGDEINIAEAEKAHAVAVELRKAAKTKVDLDKAQSLIDRQAVRIHVANLRRRHRAHRR